MTFLLTLVHLMAFAFFVSLAISGFMMAAQVTDVPNGRSSHTVVTPTSGGIGVVAGMAAGLAILRMFYPQLEDPLLFFGIASLGVLVAVLGLVDDKFELPARLKFIVMIMVSLAVPAITGVPDGLPVAGQLLPIPYWIAYLGAALWVFVVVNAVNFMDGANGLMGGFMAVTSLGLAAFAFFADETSVAILAAGLAASLCGFLPYNARAKARIFCGDAGSLFTGFVFAAASLHLASRGHSPAALYAGPMLLLPFLVDVLLTLYIRLRRGENLLSPHKSHLYHLMIAAGRTHLQVSFSYVRNAVLMVMATFAGGVTGFIGIAAYFIFWIFIISGLYALRRNWFSRRLKRLAERRLDDAAP